MVIGYGYNIEAARRVKEEIANAGVPLQDDQAPPKQPAPLGYQASVNPPAMTNGAIRTSCIQFY